MKFVIIHGQKIDINSFKHPGGQQVLEAMAGRDCTEEFTAIHSERAWKQVRCLGVKPALGTSPFLQLHQQLRDEGLFELDTEFYWREAARIASLFALFCVLLPVQPAASALALGIFWQQLSFVGHDVGHGAMPFLRPLLVCCLGISLNWWQSSHSVHHVLTNIQEHDPDVQPCACLRPLQRKLRRLLQPLSSASYDLSQPFLDPNTTPGLLSGDGAGSMESLRAKFDSRLQQQLHVGSRLALHFRGVACAGDMAQRVPALVLDGCARHCRHFARSDHTESLHDAAAKHLRRFCNTTAFDNRQH